MHVTEVDPDDDAAFAAWFDALDDERRTVRPDEPGWLPQELRAVARAAARPGAPNRVAVLAAVDGGRTVGAARLDLPQQDNRGLAEVSFLSVRPADRRRGAGTLLLQELVRRAAADGRTDLVGGVDERPGETAPGRAFAVRHGASAAQVDVRRDLPLPVDPARLDALERQCRAHAEGYLLRTWDEECPEDLLADRALLAQRMSTDAPAGDVPRAEEAWDGARVRFGEQLLREQGRRRLSVGAVHAASGRLVAFTDLCLPTAAPERAYQWDTLVLREHRGHRLGTLVKLANLRRAAQQWPGTRSISTWNAEDNAPMIAVNEALGCTVVLTSTTWRRAL